MRNVQYVSECKRMIRTSVAASVRYIQNPKKTLLKNILLSSVEHIHSTPIKRTADNPIQLVDSIK